MIAIAPFKVAANSSAQQASEKINKTLANDLAFAYQNALRQRYPVEIDQEALQNLF